VAGLRDCFGAAMTAAYLYGAITFADSEAVADFDYHVLLAARPDQTLRAGYRELLADLRAGYADCADLDGWVISLAAARGPEPPAHLIFDGMRDEAWALHRAHWLAGRCMVLAGPQPAEIVPVPTWAEQRTGLAAELAFAARTDKSGDAYTVLNCCRILRSLAEHDVVQSKFGSARWALGHLPAEYAPAILAAMNRYRGTATDADHAAVAAGREPLLRAAALALAGPGHDLSAEPA
jgi:Aminoglycoside adenylyltransferase, C-terminal domain